MVEIHLDPKQVRFNELLAARPEELVVMQGIAPLLKDRLLESIVATDFDRATVESDLRRIVVEAPEGLLQRLLRDEAQLEHSDKTITRRAREALGDDLSNAKLPPNFLRGVAESLTQSFSVLHEIEQLRAAPVGQAIIGLIREMAPHVAAMQQGEGVDRLYNYVCSRENDPSLIVTSKDIEHLHFLMYLPYVLRYPVQDLLIQRSCIEALRQKALSWESPAESTCAGLLETRLWQHCRYNRHWLKLVEWFGASDDLVKRLGEQELELMNGMKQIRDEVPLVALSPVYRTVVRFHEGLERTMRAADLRQPTRLWHQIDVGHCFHRDDFALDHIIQGAVPFTFVDEKSGSYAVVLEDDAQQMERWSSAIESHSVYTMLPDGAGRCSDVNAIRSRLADPRVAFYLLDIENDGNRGAGILVARTLITNLMQSDLTIFPKHISIVVWSSSHELVATAKRELEDFVNTAGYEKQVFFYRGNGQISVVISLKSGLPFFPYLQ